MAEVQLTDVLAPATATISEAEYQRLLKKFRKVQKQNEGLLSELELAKRKLGRLKQEKNLLLDRVYEREVDMLELSSTSTSDEDGFDDGNESDVELPSKRRPTTTSSTKKPAAASAQKRNGATPKTPKSPNAMSTMRASSASMADEVELEGSLESPLGGGGKKRVVKTAEAAAATPRRAQAVPLDEDGQPILPLTFGVVTIYNLGSVVYDRPTFHNKRYIWPVGFKSSRQYLSAVDLEKLTTYYSRIIDGGSGPLFEVSAEDNPGQLFQSPTSTGAWSSVVKQANTIRGRDYTNSASGPDFFGLSNSTVAMLIEKLPNAERCASYQKKTFETVPSGPVRTSARTSARKVVSSLSNTPMAASSEFHDDYSQNPSELDDGYNGTGTGNEDEMTFSGPDLGDDMHGMDQTIASSLMSLASEAQKS